MDCKQIRTNCGIRIAAIDNASLVTTPSREGLRCLMRPVSMNVAVRQTVENGADRRAFGRRETRMPATVRLPNHTLLDCVVCDISEGGALLEFPAPVSISGRLRLSFDGGNQELICEVRHTRGNRMGVQFSRNISLIARPIAAPVEAAAPMPVLQRLDVAAEKSRITAASELVAARRNAAKVKREPVATPDPVAQTVAARIVIEIPTVEALAVEPSVPRDMSGLLQSVAALAAERAVPRPLPARAYATALIVEPVSAPEEIVPRNMASLLSSVQMLAATRAVPRPMPACAYSLIAA
jgi:PilZ domain